VIVNPIAPIVIAAYAGMGVQFLKPKNREEIYTPERDGLCPRKSFSEERSIDRVSYQSTKKFQGKGGP